MLFRNKSFKTSQAGGFHGNRKRGQQNMRSQRDQRSIFIIGIACITVDQFPKHRLIAKLFDVCDSIVVFNIQTAHKDCTNNSGCCVGTGSGKDSKDINMKLTGIRVIALKCCQLCYSFLVLKELGIRLHRLPHLGCCGHTKLLHTDR